MKGDSFHCPPSIAVFNFDVNNLKAINDVYDQLYEKADKLMYENKKELKARNITSHTIAVMDTR